FLQALCVDNDSGDGKGREPETKDKPNQFGCYAAKVPKMKRVGHFRQPLMQIRILGAVTAQYFTGSRIKSDRACPGAHQPGVVGVALKNQRSSRLSRQLQCCDTEVRQYLMCALRIAVNVRS